MALAAGPTTAVALAAEPAAAVAAEVFAATQAAAAEVAFAPAAEPLPPLPRSRLSLSLVCSITQDYMQDPVVTADGQTYERAAIEQWMQQQQRRQLPPSSPLTGEPLEHTNLVPNVALRSLIRELLAHPPASTPAREA